MKFWPFNRAPQGHTVGSDGTTTASEPLVLANSSDKVEPVMNVQELDASVRAHASDMSSRPETAAPGQEVEPARAPRRWAKALGRIGSSAGERPEALPIRVIMGYLPEVSARDAKEYAQGMAEKHFEQMGLSYFDSFEFGNGHVFEAHEGGDGKAFAPGIIKYFESLGPYQVGEVNSVTIRTASRLLEVQRMREGLAAIVLPETAQALPTPWLKATTSMTPGLNRRTAFLYSGVAVFATGVIAMLLSASVFRLQPYTAAPAQKVEAVSAAGLPRSQWARLEAVPPNSYVKALRYRNDTWEAPEIVTEAPVPSATEQSAPPPPSLAPVPAAGSPSITKP